jgi:hypothetical protein
MMHTVCETLAFRRAAEKAGMTADEISNLVDLIADNPGAGEEIVGTGGCRKVRVAGRGKGKSGGYRTITFYSGDEIPVYLLTVFSKGEKSTLTARECSDLRLLTKALVAEHRTRKKALRREL